MNKTIDPAGREVTYFISERLKLRGKLDIGSREITIKDTLQGKPCLITYMPEETILIRNTICVVSREVHMIKKVFGGVVVDNDGPGERKGMYSDR